MSGDGDDIRADVTAALAGTLGEDNGELPSAEAPDAGGSKGGDAPAAPVAEGVEAAPAESGASPEDAPKPGEGGRVRDASGRFVQGKGDTAPKVAPKPASSAAAPADRRRAADLTAKPGQPPPVPGGAPAAPPAPELKAPQAWKPAARETWAALPPAVKAEVTRIENDTKAALREAAQARAFNQEFHRAVSPYMATIQSEGSNPAQFIGGLLQTAQALRTAPPAHKAQLVANIVRQFGVPIEALDSALAGGPLPQGQQGGQQQGEFRDPRFDEFLGSLEQAKQQRQQTIAQQAAADIDEFQKSAEFLPDVKEHMSVLLHAAAQRRQSMTLQQAYDKACWADEEIRGILQKRGAAQAANASQASTQRARAASMSVRSKPATAAPPAAKSGGVEDDVRAALAELRSR
jgi:hypothetical protein